MAGNEFQKGLYPTVDFLSKNLRNFLLVKTTGERLAPGDGITVGGPFTRLVDATVPEIPSLPTRNPSGVRPLGFVLLAVGAAYAELVGVLWSGLLWFRYGLVGKLRSEPSMASSRYLRFSVLLSLGLSCSPQKSLVDTR